MINLCLYLNSKQTCDETNQVQQYIRLLGNQESTVKINLILTKIEIKIF